MASIFNFSTLNTILDSKTRSITVELNRPDLWNAINFEMMFELESLLSWCASHMEINTILLTSRLEFLSKGFDYNEFLKTPDHKIQKYLIKFQKLIHSMFFLPQTILIDLRHGAIGAAAELAIGADIRFAHEQSSIHFNHLDMGLIPACGGVGFLSTVIPKSTAKNWVLSSQPITMNELISSGFIYKSYTDETIIKTQMKKISEQSPVARIQAKRSMLESIIPDLEHAMEYEKNFAFGAMYAEDWKRSIKAKLEGKKPEFISAMEFKDILKTHKKLNVTAEN